MSEDAHTLIAPALRRPFSARMRQALPSPRVAVLGAISWALLLTGSAFLGLKHWATPAHTAAVLLPYAAGAMMAFPVAMFLAEAIAREKRPTQRFAAAFLSLATATIGLTAALLAMDYRAYYAHSHEEAFSRLWVLQIIGTALSALYQFAVIGLRLYFPLGFIGLFAASAWFAARAR